MASTRVEAAALVAVSTVKEGVSPSPLGASLSEWRVGVLVASVLMIATTVLDRIWKRTRREAGRLPTLTLWVGRPFMRRDDFRFQYTEVWLPDLRTLMREDAKTWQDRSLRYMETIAYAFSMAFKGARKADDALHEGRPTLAGRTCGAIGRTVRSSAFEIGLILLLAAGTGCGITAMAVVSLSLTMKLIMGGALGLAAMAEVLLVLAWWQRTRPTADGDIRR